MDITLRVATPAEQNYAYSQSQQIVGQTGCIGHLRADLGHNGSDFYSSWDDHDRALKDQAFKDEFDKVINLFRDGENYEDKDGNAIHEHDFLRFDDGTVQEVFELEDGSLGTSDSNPDYLAAHPNTDEFFAPLQTSPGHNGARKVANATVDFDRSPKRDPQAIPAGHFFRNLAAVQKFCYTHPQSAIGPYDREYAFRADTKKHTYIVRLNPNQGDYNLYCYCYQRKPFERHLHNAEKGIRFIDPHYKELFHIDDGDSIRISLQGGGDRDRTVRYIDDFHIQLDSGMGVNLYHICEFAERVQKAGCSVIPLRKSLPDLCYSYLEAVNQIVILRKGETGYYKTDFPVTDKEDGRQIVSEHNRKLRVSRAQEAAMVCGSMFGFDKPGADPKQYNENGEFIRAQKRTKTQER